MTLNTGEYMYRAEDILLGNLSLPRLLARRDDVRPVTVTVQPVGINGQATDAKLSSDLGYIINMVQGIARKHYSMCWKQASQILHDT
jgi:hypothetical protein